MLREIWTFIRRHWLHLLLVAPGALLITVLHEGAHAAAVILQGGTVSEFVWLPGKHYWGSSYWGYVSYDPPALAPFSEFFVSIAPYLLWLFLAMVAVVLSRRRRQFAFWTASSMYGWLFVAPLADVANTAFPYLAGRDNDFMSAFGPPSLSAWVLIVLLGALALIIGHPLQRRLYRTQGLCLQSYVVLSSAVILLIVSLTARII